MKMKECMEGKSSGDRICLAAGLLTIVTLVVYSIYGAVYQYFDIVAFVMLLLAAALITAGVFFNGKLRLIGITKLLAAMLVSGAFAIFFYNSFPVWADEINHITMYSSRGGLAPVIGLCVLFIIDLVGLVVSCFMKDGGSL